MSRAAGWAPAGAARGMATTFYCGSFVEGKPKKLPTKVGYLFQAAQRLKTATRALVKELVQMARTRAVATAFGIFSRLEVTHVNFLFLLFAHITFLSCVFGFGLCQSRRIVAVPLRPSRLGSGRPNGSAYLSNASAVELHAPQNLRPSFPSTNSQAPYYHYLCHEIFGLYFFRNLQLLIDHLMTCSTVSYSTNAIG
jgi:hypothetical protein